MKGLLLNDIYSMKKNLKIVAVLSIYFAIMLVVSSQYTSTAETNIAVYFICGLLPCFFSSCSIFSIDEKTLSKNNIFLHTLPINQQIFAYQKYIITYALILISYFVLGITIINMIFISNYHPNRTTFFLCFVVFSMLLILINIEIPLTMRFGQGIASGILIGVICFAFVAGLSIFVKINMSMKMNYEFNSIFKYKLLITLILICVDVFSSLVSINTTKKILIIK